MPLLSNIRSIVVGRFPGPRRGLPGTSPPPTSGRNWDPMGPPDRRGLHLGRCDLGGPMGPCFSGGKITKRYDEPIDVSAADREWGPATFVWRGRRYQVDRPLATWHEATHASNSARRSESSHAGGSPRRDAGTNGNGSTDRAFFRLLARPEGSLATGDLDADGYMQHVGSGAVYDVYLDPVRNEWRLARVWD
jgi:Family of unknown function (DUF6504)